MCLDAIGETAQAGPVVGVGPADAVVDDLDDERCPRPGDVDAH
jgi:hypothetical protein